MKGRVVTSACVSTRGDHSQEEALEWILENEENLARRMKRLMFSWWREHGQRLGSEIHLQWVLRVCRIPVSMEDKQRREEARMGK